MWMCAPAIETSVAYKEESAVLHEFDNSPVRIGRLIG